MLTIWEILPCGIDSQRFTVNQMEKKKYDNNARSHMLLTLEEMYEADRVPMTTRPFQIVRGNE